MRPLLILALLPALIPALAGCALLANPLLMGASAGAIPIFRRTPIDMAVSAATGRDCSIVRLDKGEDYCREPEGPPEPPVFCTRSLGVADCWSHPRRLPNNPKEIADGPRTLTPAQDANRTRAWPGPLPDLRIEPKPRPEEGAVPLGGSARGRGGGNEGRI